LGIYELLADVGKVRTSCISFMNLRICDEVEKQMKEANEKKGKRTGRGMAQTISENRREDCSFSKRLVKGKQYCGIIVRTIIARPSPKTACRKCQKLGTAGKEEGRKPTCGTFAIPATLRLGSSHVKVYAPHKVRVGLDYPS
jgi:hypothetical protein